MININVPGDGEEAVRLSGEVHSGADPCNQYIAAAQAALRAANPVPPPPDQAELIKYTDCMRANGFPNYPYPTANMTFQGTGVDPYSPQVENVSKRCGTELICLVGGSAATVRPETSPFPTATVRTRESPALLLPSERVPQAGPGRQREVGFQWLSSPPRRIAAIAAVAGALVGGAVAGGVAVAATSGNGDSPAGSSGAGSSVATAAVVRTTLTNTVQVGGSIGYEGSFTVAAPSGVSAQQVAQAQQAVTEDQQTLSADEQAESDASTADNQAISADQTNVNTAPVHPQLRPGQEDQGLRREGGVHAGVRPGRPDGQPGPDRSLTQANAAAGAAQSSATGDHDQNQAKVVSDETRLQG